MIHSVSQISPFHFHNYDFSKLYFTAPGSRAFNVKVENSLLMGSLDVVQEVGPKTAFVLEQIYTVTDGAVTIELDKSIENPMISGIEIISTSAPTPPPTPPTPSPTAPPASSITRINVGGGEYTDTVGNIWQADAYFGGKGSAYTACPAIIPNSDDDDLYCSNRWFGWWTPSPLRYEIPVPANDQYQVNLHFAEIVSPQYSQRECSLFVHCIACFSHRVVSFDVFTFGTSTSQMLDSECLTYWWKDCLWQMAWIL